MFDAFRFSENLVFFTVLRRIIIVHIIMCMDDSEYSRIVCFMLMNHSLVIIRYDKRSLYCNATCIV